MEELSVKEKAQRYDEAIKKAKYYYDKGKTLEYANDIVSDVFPELKESGDERIRKEIIAHIKWCEDSGYCAKEEMTRWITFLEKQGEQMSADKVEPKFHEGEWCIDNEDDTIFQIVKVLDNTYTYKTNEGKEYSCTHYSLENDARLWTIQDAKDGDVLVASDGSIFLFKCTIDCACKHYVALTTDNVVKFNEGLEHYWETSTTVHPATKEQSDLLFKKMKEAGYEWDVERKELKKIIVPIFNIGDTIAKKHNSDIHDFGSFTITDITGGKYWYNDRIICDITEQDEWEIYEFVEQKPADKVEPKFHKGDWVVVSTTKGDRVVQIASVEYFKDGYPSYITTEGRWFGNGTKARLLTDKDVETITLPESKFIVNQKPAWSEEDEEHIDSLLKRLEGMCKKGATFTTTRFAISEDIDWLKSLRPQKQNITNKDFEDIIREIKTRIAQCNGFNRKHREGLFTLLDSLRLQSHWKPSDEQMNMLRKFIEYFDVGVNGKEILTTLYNDLKKLREE